MSKWDDEVFLEIAKTDKNCEPKESFDPKIHTEVGTLSEDQKKRYTYYRHCLKVLKNYYMRVVHGHIRCNNIVAAKYARRLAKVTFARELFWDNVMEDLNLWRYSGRLAIIKDYKIVAKKDEQPLIPEFEEETELVILEEFTHTSSN